MSNLKKNFLINIKFNKGNLLKVTSPFQYFSETSMTSGLICSTSTGCLHIYSRDLDILLSPTALPSEKRCRGKREGGERGGGVDGCPSYAGNA